MSGYRKGMRKSKPVEIKEINIGGLKVSPALLIVFLLATLYALFLFGSQIEKGTDSLVLSAFSLLAFAVFSYLSRSGSLAGLRPFRAVIDAFLALSALTFILDAASFFNVIPVTGSIMDRVNRSIILAVLTVLLIWLLLFLEKSSASDAFIKDCNRTSMLSGIAGFIICAIVGIGVLYFMFGGSAMNLNKLGYLIGVILAFSMLSATYEEAWFRGLLLSRLEPLLGEKRAIITQALVFGVFEAFAVYAISPQLIYLPFVFVIGSILGYYWGRMTLKDESIVSAALFHAGFYALIGMPLFAGLL